MVIYGSYIVFNSFNDIISREINNSIIIADNMQEYKLKHLSNLVNINGYKSKLIINGDVDKYDTKDTDLMLLRDIMNVQSYDFFERSPCQGTIAHLTRIQRAELKSNVRRMFRELKLRSVRLSFGTLRMNVSKHGCADI